MIYSQLLIRQRCHVLCNVSLEHGSALDDPDVPDAHDCPRVSCSLLLVLVLMIIGCCWLVIPLAFVLVQLPEFRNELLQSGPVFFLNFLILTSLYFLIVRAHVFFVLRLNFLRTWTLLNSRSLLLFWRDVDIIRRLKNILMFMTHLDHLFWFFTEL